MTLHYRLAGPDGRDIVSTFNGPPATLTLGAGQLAPALEARLQGLSEGQQARFEVPAGEAFGPRNPAMVQRIKRSALQGLADPAAVYAVGDAVEFPTPDGRGRFAGVVQAVGDDWLEFDFNHPLAGRAVVFEVQLIGVL